MERQRSSGPRATRSKKSLPSAFSRSASRGQEPRLASPQPPPGDAAAQATDSLLAPLPPGPPPPEPASTFHSPGPELPGPELPAVPSSSSTAPVGPEPPSEPPHGAESSGREAILLGSLVFLSSCPQRHGHAVLKKMLHPPTLGLYCLVELPGADNQRAPLRAALQDWLRRWCALQTERPDLLVAVCETFWDAPSGYPMGILCEYMPLGSLDELIQACGGLPEEAMREIAQAVLEALHALHSVQPPVVHGCLKPSQVLFSADGRPRLAFGLEQRLKGCQALLVAQQESNGFNFDYEVRRIQFEPGKPMPPEEDPHMSQVVGADGAHAGFAVPAEKAVTSYPIGAIEQQSAAVDIFDLGLLLLVSALGGMDVLLDAIPYAREFGSRSERAVSAPLNVVSADTCALLQRELRVAAAAGLTPVAGAHQGSMDSDLAGEAGIPGDPASVGDMGYLPPASDLLFNRRYSEPFLAFVSTCLEAHTRAAPVSASDLLQHEFLQSSGTAGPIVTLREMQELARVLNEAPEQHHEWGRLGGPSRTARSTVPGVVAQSSQMYLANIAQSVAPHCGPSGVLPRGARSRTTSDVSEAPHPQLSMHPVEYETLLVDSARTLGLSREVVQSALEAQLDRILEGRERRGGGEVFA